MSSWPGQFSGSSIERRIKSARRRSARVVIQHLHQENIELKKQIDELRVYRKLAYQDHLTSLRNRRYFYERLDQEIQRGRRHGTPVSIVVIDLDDFKRFNDEAGHEMGDRVLRRFGEFLTSCQRRFDIPCRVGGDEFALILPETDAEGAASVLERLQGVDLDIRFSVGAASYPDDGRDVDALVTSADDRMFGQKKERTSPKRFAG